MTDATISSTSAPAPVISMPSLTIAAVVKTDLASAESSVVAFIKAHASKAIAAGVGFAAGQLHLVNFLIRLV